MSLDPFTAGFDLVKTGLDKFFPDANIELKGKLEAAAQEIGYQFQLQLEQIKVNEKEAEHPSIWVAGARPAVIWTGVAGFGYTSLIQPILAWISTMFGIPVPPVIDISALATILSGILGFGVMRSVDKFNSVDTKRLK